MAFPLARSQEGLVVLLLLLFAWPAFAAPVLPALTGRVVDAANILSPAVERQLDEASAKLEAKTSDQLVVVTVPSLQGYEIEDYGYRLGRAWGIGQKKADNGVILLVAPNERRVRIEVGYGLEPFLTDAWSSQTIRRLVIPRFKKGDLPGGITAGAQAIIHQLSIPRDEARRLANPEYGPLVYVVAALFVLVPLVILWFILAFIWAVIRDARRKGWRAWLNSGGSSTSRSSWSSSSSSHSSSRSSFSGGGGSFGGGGASGSW